MHKFLSKINPTFLYFFFLKNSLTLSIEYGPEITLVTSSKLKLFFKNYYIGKIKFTSIKFDIANLHQKVKQNLTFLILPASITICVFF